MKIISLKPGLLGWFHRFINEIDVRHWAVERGRELLGVVSWQGSRRYADYMWMAAPPEYEDIVLRSVFPYIRRERRFSRPVALDIPEVHAADTLTEAGFEKASTLIWMEVKHEQGGPF